MATVEASNHLSRVLIDRSSHSRNVCLVNYIVNIPTFLLIKQVHFEAILRAKLVDPPLVQRYMQLLGGVISSIVNFDAAHDTVDHLVIRHVCLYLCT